ncbi:hypothetical protein K439DRAFT_832018 [Ramaria rubella]|nr:hypothetical protein K439DRAFT_832018 [Ramaria rubella]
MAPQMVIVFPLTTTITISSLPTPLPTALVSFIPSYNARSDGSLITFQYMQEVSDANVQIFIVGSLLMLFTRNAIVSIEYLYRSRSKDKTLFYLLLASQLLGPACFISLAVSYLTTKVNCTIIYMMSLVFIALSLSFLITGILGIKAYRCLDRSRVVLTVVSILQAATTVLLCFDASRLRSHRLSSGNCTVTGPNGYFPFVPICISLLFLQSLFICLCFVYTVWKASAYSAAQGRLSLAVSLETIADERDHPVSPAPAVRAESRGWWDYVPQPRYEASGAQRTTDGDNRVFGSVSRIFGYAGEPFNALPQRKPSVTSEKPLPQPHRPMVRLPEDPREPLPRVTSSTLSLQQRWVGRLSRMPFVRIAMRDELIHAAAIASNGLLTLILVAVSLVKPTMRCDPLVWIGIYWLVTSVVVMHSFSRVVKRHEREAILREPNTWESMARRQTRRPPPSSSSQMSIASHRRPHRYQGERFSPSRLSSWSDPFRSHEDVERSVPGEQNTPELVEAWGPESSPPPTPGPDFLPNHYPERLFPQPLRSPT